MYKKKITFTDYNDTVREETHFFNLNESELIHLEMETDGGLRYFLEDASDKQDIKKLSKFWDTFIRLSYGVPSADGRKFVKNEEVWEDFHQTEAYNVLYMELSTNDEKALDFITHVIPTGEKKAGNNANIVAMERAKEMAEKRIEEKKI